MLNIFFFNKADIYIVVKSPSLIKRFAQKKSFYLVVNVTICKLFMHLSRDLDTYTKLENMYLVHFEIYAMNMTSSIIVLGTF